MKHHNTAVLAIGCTLFISNVAWAGGDVEAGKVKAALCAGCHGLSGEGKAAANGQPAFPRLAGQIESYAAKAIADYQSGARTDVLMGAISKGLTDADIANLAAYFASLK